MTGLTFPAHWLSAVITLVRPTLSWCKSAQPEGLLIYGSAGRESHPLHILPPNNLTQSKAEAE